MEKIEFKDVSSYIVDDFIKDDEKKEKQEEQQVEENPEEEKQEEEQSEEKDEKKDEEVKKEEKPEKEEKQPEKEDSDESVISELQKMLGYEVDKEYEESIEGIKDFTVDVAKQIALNEFEGFYKQYPVVKEFTEYVVSGGDPNEFFKISEHDFSKVTLQEDDVDTQKDVLNVFLEKQGFGKDEIAEMIKDYEDTGILYKQSSRALPKIVELQQKQKEELIKRHEQEVIESQQREQQVWSEIEETISNGDLGGVVIPESDKKDFFKWMAVPVEEGKSQRMIDREKLEITKLLQLEYLLYKGLDVSKLVKMKKNTKNAELLRKIIDKNKGSELKGTDVKISKKEFKGIQDYI